MFIFLCILKILFFLFVILIFLKVIVFFVGIFKRFIVFKNVDLLELEGLIIIIIFF